MMAGCGRLPAAGAVGTVAAEPMVGADVLRAAPPFSRLQGRWVYKKDEREVHTASRHASEADGLRSGSPACSLPVASKRAP